MLLAKMQVFSRFVLLMRALFSDIRRLNSQAVFAKRTGMIILGGGLVKHHISNANLMVTKFFYLKLELFSLLKKFDKLGYT